MPFREFPTQEIIRVPSNQKEIELRQRILDEFYPTLPDRLIEKIIKGFRHYWKGSISKTELFRMTRMKSFRTFDVVFEDFL